MNQHPTSAATPELRAFRRADFHALRTFAEGLADHDLLFIGRDLRHVKVIDAWAKSIEDGHIHSIVIAEEGRIIGTASLVCDPLGWSPHVAELRLLVAIDARGRRLGRRMLEDRLAAAPALGFTKLTAAMTSEAVSARALFEQYGFVQEALLRDQVRERNGTLHDLAILSRRIDGDGTESA